MKYLSFSVSFLLMGFCTLSSLNAQDTSIELIQAEITRSDVEMNVHFLSSDELKGRATGSPGLDIAARYIASWFLSNKVNTLPDYESYYQKIEVPLRDTSKTISSQNVIGVVEGSHPDLKNEYLLLSAHYDHVGVRKIEASQDSIYNGARDNAVGVATIMAAGKYFADHPPKRSVILALWTAEEMGLIGSRIFVENPPVPLNQIIFNLNIDGAGYNDTTKVTIVGLERTEAEPMFKSAVQAFDLEAIPSPVPELQLFNRSDNVHFARKGIPAPTFSLGFTSFNEEIQYYYHQPTDESNTLNFDYVTDYTRAYVLAAEKIANADQAPFWESGDDYEEAGRELYGTK